MKIILETERTFLREMTTNDLPDLSEILQDPETMTAYEHAFSDHEVCLWLKRQLDRYRENGFGLWAVIALENHQFLGQCGLTLQHVEGIDELEIGYLFKRRFWHCGYATETARGVLNYAETQLQSRRTVCTIRDGNAPSQRVAERLGMQIERTFIKRYYGLDMPHNLYVKNHP